MFASLTSDSISIYSHLPICDLFALRRTLRSSVSLQSINKWGPFWTSPQELQFDSCSKPILAKPAFNLDCINLSLLMIVSFFLLFVKWKQLERMVDKIGRAS